MDQQNVENDVCLNQDDNRWSIYSNSILKEIAKVFKDAIFEVALTARTPEGDTNLVQVEPFYRTEEEDPFDVTANWYDGIRTILKYWNNENNPDASFVPYFTHVTEPSILEDAIISTCKIKAKEYYNGKNKEKAQDNKKLKNDLNSLTCQMQAMSEKLTAALNLHAEVVFPRFYKGYEPKVKEEKAFVTPVTATNHILLKD
ncbi:16953_t:CDS:2, partial [Cetraspora pellucida]